MRKDSSRAWRRTRRTAIITAALSWTRLGNEPDGAPASALTALELGGERLSVERFDLTELIASVISSSGVLLKQNELTVDFDGKEPVYVMGDELK